jgi:peroxiredoxin Q/BCP
MALSVGDAVPHFTAIDDNGLVFDSANFANKIVVIYFYPKD